MLSVFFVSSSTLFTGQRRPTTSGAGTATEDTRGLHAQQIRSHSIAKGVRFLGILTKHVGEAGEQQGAPPSQATPLAPRHPHQPPPPLRKQNRRRRRRRRNKDDPAETTNPRKTRGKSAHQAKPHQRAAVGPTARHVASQAGLRRQRGKLVTQ